MAATEPGRPFVGEFVRRSYLIVSPQDREAVERAWTHNADAIVLDLHAVPYGQKPQVRPLIGDYLPLLGRGGAESFVNISRDHLWADADAAVRPGVDGLVLSHADSAADVREAEQAVSEMEKRHGVDMNSVEIVVLLGTAKAVWNIREIITASQRVTSVGVDERPLLQDLGFLPSRNDDPFIFFARGRVVMEAAGIDEFLHGHHGVYRIGMGYPLSVFSKLNASPEQVRRAAKEAKENAFNGAFCYDPSWVEPCNQGFTPTDEEIAFHRAVRKTYAEGVAMGRGAVAFPGGRFVERPTDEIAKKIMRLREMCDERDTQKAAARAAAE